MLVTKRGSKAKTFPRISGSPQANAFLPPPPAGMFKSYLLLPLLIPLALMKRDFSGGLIYRLERWVGRLAVRPWQGVTLVGIISFLLSMGLSLCLRIPAPQTHDEFAYLLLAGLASHMWVLVAGRLVQGFGGGLVGVALFVVVGRAYPAA